VISLGFFRQLAALFAAVVFSGAASRRSMPRCRCRPAIPAGGRRSANPNHAHYLIQRPEYAMDYNDTTREPNWVAWDLTSDDVGSSGRSNFIVDTTLPTGSTRC